MVFYYPYNTLHVYCTQLNTVPIHPPSPQWLCAEYATPNLMPPDHNANFQQGPKVGLKVMLDCTYKLNSDQSFDLIRKQLILAVILYKLIQCWISYTGVSQYTHRRTLLEKQRLHLIGLAQLPTPTRNQLQNYPMYCHGMLPSSLIKI